MNREIVQTGETVEEALNSACMILGVELEEVKWEIIDLPRTSFFGLKKVPAKVRVIAPALEEPEKPAKPQPKKAEAVERPVRKQQEKAKAPKQERKPIKQRKQEQATPAPEKVTKEEILKDVAPGTRGQDDEDINKAKVAVAYVENVIKGIGVKATPEIRWENDGLTIAIYGNNLGAIIGRKGETLNAIQYLTGLAANRLPGDYLRVIVDCGDYRLERNKSLEDMARKAANQVVKTNVSRTLEPMNPAERRIIHSTVANIKGVNSSSVGDDPYRRVVISTPTSKSRSEGRRQTRKPRTDRTNQRKERPTSSRPERPKKERAPRQERQDAPKKDIPDITKEQVGETPLYGKIEL